MTCLVAGFKLEITAVRSVVEKSTAGRFCAKLASWWHVWFVGFKEETTWRFYILATGEPRPGWSKLALLVAGYWTWLLERFRGRWPGIRLDAHYSSSPEIWGLLSNLLQVDFVQSWHYDDMFDLQESSRKLLQWGPWLSNLLQVDFVQSLLLDDLFSLQDSRRKLLQCAP